MNPSPLPELPAIGFLADLEEATRTFLASYGRFEHLKEGDTLIAEGSAQESLYLVLSGLLHVVVEGDGRKILVATLGAGDSLGEVSIFDPAKASARVVARSDALLWSLSAEELESFLQADPIAGVSLMKGLMQLTARRIRAMDAKLAYQETSPAPFWTPAIAAGLGAGLVLRSSSDPTEGDPAKGGRVPEIEKRKREVAPVRPSGLDQLGQVLAATDELRTERGRLSAIAVADLFGISPARLAAWLDANDQTVSNTPDAASLQPALQYFERVARLRLRFSPENFREWLRLPNPLLSGKPPLDLMAEGAWQVVADLVDDMLTGNPT